MPVFRIFVSYTLKGSDVKRKLLRELKAKLSTINSLKTYIDIIDNNNKEDPQGYVMSKLAEADFVILIRSKHVNSSVWVKKELELADKLNKPVVQISLRNAKRIAYYYEKLPLSFCFYIILHLIYETIAIKAKMTALSLLTLFRNFFTPSKKLRINTDPQPEISSAIL